MLSIDILRERIAAADKAQADMRCYVVTLLNEDGSDGPDRLVYGRQALDGLLARIGELGRQAVVRSYDSVVRA